MSGCRWGCGEWGGRFSCPEFGFFFSFSCQNMQSFAGPGLFDPLPVLVGLKELSIFRCYCQHNKFSHDLTVFIQIGWNPTTEFHFTGAVKYGRWFSWGQVFTSVSPRSFKKNNSATYPLARHYLFSDQDMQLMSTVHKKKGNFDTTLIFMFSELTSIKDFLNSDPSIFQCILGFEEPKIHLHFALLCN